MKALVVRTLSAVAALALAMAIGYAVQPAAAAPVAAPDCVAKKIPAAPIAQMPMVREHLVAI